MYCYFIVTLIYKAEILFLKLHIEMPVQCVQIIMADVTKTVNAIDEIPNNFYFSSSATEMKPANYS